ncbi:MAG TPA: YggT family protein [Polyangiaceae bacterium]|jgi:YggT family protein
MLALLFNVYSFVVLLAVIASWLRLAHDHPVVRVTSTLTEPLLGPIRRVIPSVGGLDFSPLVLLFGLRLLERLVV